MASYPKVDGPVAKPNGVPIASKQDATIPLGLYIWKRIKQLGISRVFGVPGDFNLTLLDHIYEVDGLEWTGNTNELNAAYATDGYARVKNSAGCFVTTHGVGELSALNGVAGSMTEQVKTIHIVGQTSRRMQEQRLMIHHSIGFNPDHQIFSKASKGFRVAAAELQDEKTAPQEVDRVLRECFIKSRPVYIFVPIDMVPAAVPAGRLDTPIDLSPPEDKGAITEAASSCLQAIYAAKNPAVFVDCLVRQHDAVKELHGFLEKLQIPIYSSHMGKGIVDEDSPRFVGVYNGVASQFGIHEAFESTDLTLVVGDLPSDTNSGGFTRKIAQDKAIYINPDSANIKGDKIYSDTPIKRMLTHLASEIAPDKVPKVKVPTLPPRPVEDDIDSKAVTQSWVWHRLAKFLQTGDVVIGETGTASFGIPDTVFPAGVRWVAQTYYGSIGWATPAAFGADIAMKELIESKVRSSGRTILVTGDGSLMLTVQEVGNMVKQGASPLVFIINNAGYTIERVIHGAKMSYNDIVPFDYSHMLSFFSMPVEQAKSSFHRAENKAELESILQKDSVKNPKSLQIVEVVMDMMDVPWRLATQIATRGPEAIKEMEEGGIKVRRMGNLEGFRK